jgi:TolA-binding protein
MKINFRNRINLRVSGLLVFALFFSANGYGQSDNLTETVAGKQESEIQRVVEEHAVDDIQTLHQFIKDSLQLTYEESFLEQQDSIANMYISQIADIINQCTNKRDSLERQIQALRDSLSIISVLGGIGYDREFEAKYFDYGKTLKREEAKTKSGLLFLSSEIENIYSFQISELEQYIDRFFPEARCDFIQDFLTQLYIRKRDWKNAALSLIKCIYLYPESPLSEEIKTIRSGIFQTEKYYKNYSDYLTTVIATTPAYPKMDVRYFKFVELIKDFPDPDIRASFVKEARKFLEFYPLSGNAPKVCLWIAEDLLKNEKSQSAYITLHRLMIFYPDCIEMPAALYNSAKIQEKNFQEYQNAIDNYYRFIERFPDDTLAAYAHYRIAKLADSRLNNWEKATQEYQIAADLFLPVQKTKMCIAALTRRAQILSEEMNLIQDAVSTYRSIDAHFPNTPDAHQALMAAGDLFNRYKQYESAAFQYINLYEKYPEAENVLDALGKAVKIYSGRINNQDKTIETLNIIINNYPGSKSEAWATKRLKKLEKVK